MLQPPPHKEHRCTAQVLCGKGVCDGEADTTGSHGQTHVRGNLHVYMQTDIHIHNVEVNKHENVHMTAYYVLLVFPFMIHKAFVLP